MSATTQEICNYLKRYIEEYRKEYSRLVTPAPAGGGYPSLEISPYLYSSEITCWIAEDGVVIIDESRAPDYLWWIAGGPALMVDFKDSRTPQTVIDLLKKEGIYGKTIGIYRIVAEHGIPEDIWRGDLSAVLEEASAEVNGTRINAIRVEYSRAETLQRLTFGALEYSLNLHLKDSESSFWVPHIIRRLGFCTADRDYRRFVNYMEITPHVEEAAWDTRNIFVRVQADVRRDFAWSFGFAEKRGGSISLGEAQSWIQPFYDRLSRLLATIDNFSLLLRKAGDQEERIFHDFLMENPILLDVYAEAVSKPRFVYPKGESPSGKKFIEPDFILKYTDGSYKLVELERPSKLIATKQGQPRSEVTQAVFQIAEWRTFIANHYDTIKHEFPGISTSTIGMLIIGRSTERSFGERQDIHKYKQLLRTQYANIDVLTYDELLERARGAYTRLSGLAVSV